MWNKQSVGEKTVKKNGQDEPGDFGEGRKGYRLLKDIECNSLYSTESPCGLLFYVCSMYILTPDS